ncbi:hypothetical protein [Nocardia brasiliensis]|nr:hypothetical protein [Nocardia brasiliensis]
MTPRYADGTLATPTELDSIARAFGYSCAAEMDRALARPREVKP